MSLVRTGYHAGMKPRMATSSRLVVVSILLAAGTITLGCQRKLFPKDSPRTQFETYDRMRQKFVPLEQPDVFGEPKPALRARLGSV